MKAWGLMSTTVTWRPNRCIMSGKRSACTAYHQYALCLRLPDNTVHHMYIGTGADAFDICLAVGVAILVIGKRTIPSGFYYPDISEFRVEFFQ